MISDCEEFRILSDEAVVVSGRVPCWNCRADVEVICLYCQTGFVDGEATLDFSVSNVTAVDEPLRVQLVRWPTFRPIRGRGGSSDSLLGRALVSSSENIRTSNHGPAYGMWRRMDRLISRAISASVSPWIRAKSASGPRTISSSSATIAAITVRPSESIPRSDRRVFI